MIYIQYDHSDTTLTVGKQIMSWLQSSKQIMNGIETVSVHENNTTSISRHICQKTTVTRDMFTDKSVIYTGHQPTFSCVSCTHEMKLVSQTKKQNCSQVKQRRIVCADSSKEEQPLERKTAKCLCSHTVHVSHTHRYTCVPLYQNKTDVSQFCFYLGTGILAFQTPCENKEGWINSLFTLFLTHSHSNSIHSNQGRGGA